MFKDDVVTAEEEKLLKALDKRLDEIYGEPPEVELTEAQNKQLDNLFIQLDELYGYEPLSKQQLVNAEKIMIELEVLSARILPDESYHIYDKEGGKV